MKTRILKSALMWLLLESEMLRIRKDFEDNSFNLLIWQIVTLWPWRPNVSSYGVQWLESPAKAQVSYLLV